MKTSLYLVNPPFDVDRDPVRIYLGKLSPTGARSMRSKLNTAARLIGRQSFSSKNLIVEVLTARAALRNAGGKPSTINSTISALKGVARAAWQIGDITAEDYQKIRDVEPVKGSRLPRGRAHSHDELSAILKACNDQTIAGKRDAALFAIAHSAGLRRDECARLDVADCVITNGRLRIRGKGDKERIGYVKSPGGQAAIIEWLRIRGPKTGPLFCPVKKNGKLELRRLTGKSLYNAIVKRARAAGVDDVTPHNLRRTFATNLLNKGIDLKLVKELLGHASITTTQIYDHRDEEAKETAAASIEFPFEVFEEQQLKLF